MASWQPGCCRREHAGWHACGGACWPWAGPALSLLLASLTALLPANKRFQATLPAFAPPPAGLLQTGLLRSPTPTPPGSFVVLVGEEAGRVFAVGAGREAAERVRAFRERMGDAAMDAEPYHLMRQRQVALLTALLVWGDSYRMDVLGREGERALWCSCLQASVALHFAIAGSLQLHAAAAAWHAPRPCTSDPVTVCSCS